MYDKLVEEPVLVSDVRPQLRVKMIENELADNGYFNNSASYELVHNKKNSKKAKISYTVTPGAPYLIDSIEFLPDTSFLYHKIDSIAGRLPYFTPGMRYSVDSLNTARIHIANELRNRGYYFFRPEFIEYLADSTITRERIALRLTVARNTPAYALERFSTGKVTVVVNRNTGGGTPDTIQEPDLTLVRMRPLKLRTAVIPECVTFRPGTHILCA